MSFDVLGARRAGYSDEEIVQEMVKDQTFDVMGARRAGYSLEEIAREMSGMPPVGAQVAPGQEISPGVQEAPGVLSQWAQQAANVPKSAYELGKGMIGGVKAFIPGTEEAEALGKTIGGAAEKLIPGRQAEEVYAEGVAKFMTDRFGGLENLQKTAQEDPVGFTADVASLLTGVGAIFRFLGIAGKVGQVARVGETIGQLGRAAEPVGLAAKGMEQVSRAGKGPTTWMLGKTTGMGTEVAEEMARGTRPVARIGRFEGEQIAREARTGLDAIKEERATQYSQRLQTIKQATQELDITALQNKLDDVVKRFNIKSSTKPTQRGLAREFDFSRSTIDKASEADVKRIIDLVDDWGYEAGDLTPVGLDTLKRRLDDFYSPSKNSRVLVGELRNEVKNILVKNVPEYEQMVTDYAKMSELSEQIQNALSLGKKANTDTVLRKLITGIKEDSGFRRQLMDDLEQYSGKDIRGMISEYVAKPIASRSISSGITAAGAGLGMYFDWSFLALLAAASPRLVSEFLNLMGKGERAAKAVAKAVPGPAARLGAFQAGRIGLMPEMEQ